MTISMVAAIRSLRINVESTYAGIEDTIDEITAAARTDEGRRELHLLAYHTERIACCLKAALATPAD
jgi:hypothetical protein